MYAKKVQKLLPPLISALIVVSLAACGDDKGSAKAAATQVAALTGAQVLSLGSTNFAQLDGRPLRLRCPGRDPTGARLTSCLAGGVHSTVGVAGGALTTPLPAGLVRSRRRSRQRLLQRVARQ